MAILINSTSTTFGPPGQWIYVNGEGFTTDSTIVLLDNQSVENLNVYNEHLIGFSIPINISDGFKSITIQVNDEQYLTDNFFNVGTPTEPPIFLEIVPNGSVTINDVEEWIFLSGENFVWNQTSITYNEKTTNCFVYSTCSCGFQKNINETITSLTLTTPNGSVIYTVE
jgi:hypothetical protein